MYQANVYKIMIGAPSDIQEEIQIACQVINRWNNIHSETTKCILLPLHWSFSSYPSSGMHPQKMLDKQLVEKSDLMLCFFGAKLGTATDTEISGTVEEINEHLRAGKKVMVFFRKQIDSSKLDVEQFQKLKEYKKTIQDKVIWVEYNNEQDLEPTLLDKLCLFVNDNWKGYESQQREIEDNKELEAVKAELAKYKDDQQKYIKDLAGLDEKIRIRGSITHAIMQTTQHWQCDVTWKQLFESIAPFLLVMLDDMSVQTMLASIAYSYLGKQVGNLERADINIQDFQTIKVQFWTLKLIRLDYTKTTKGGMALFWTLTESGKQLMIQLRTVKTANPNPFKRNNTK